MDEDIQEVKIVFDAVAEGPADTKAVLDGQLGDAIRQIVWEPGDEVGMNVNGPYQYVAKFTNIETEVSNHASFEGPDYRWSTVYAFYPYSEDIFLNYNYEMVFALPSEQQYYPGSFAHGSMPMVARGRYGETLQFKALCGALALNLVGEGAVKSVTFMAYDESGAPVYLAGRYSVGMNYESVPEINSDPEVDYSNMSTSLTLNCGDGVTLDPSAPTPFYFVVPVGTYSSFRVVIAMTDGRMMFKEGKNPLTIKRANVTKTGSLPFVEVETVDLSLTGRSNCYQISDAGIYSFDATVMGNGEFGLLDNVDFHTKNPTISPVTAEVLWQDRAGVIGSVSCDGERISFLASGTKGNALIAAKDENGNILWSWHIWATDQPEDQIYVNDRGSFTMQDRNLGAIRAERGTGEEWRESIGTFYQWGRKDPFALNRYTTYYEPGYDTKSVIENPTVYVHSNRGWTTEWNKDLWNQYQKTIYDPCPVGYRVPPMAVWNGFSKSGDSTEWYNMNVSGAFDLGWNFIYDGSNTSWYPVTGRLSYEGWYEDWVDRGRLWTSHMASDAEPAWLDFTNSGISLNNWDGEIHHGYAVRCMKDEGHVDTSYPTVKITGVIDVTSESAVVVANVTNQGVSEITERGVIWGLSEDITLENADNAVYDPGKGEYTMTIDGLSHSTRYYVKAYAINERGVSYSKPKSLVTPYEGNAVNLSRNSTANCYIVPVAYSDYVFDASVKGNSTESVGAIASAEVLWETRNTTYALEVGSVIESVELEGNNVKFRLPFDCKPGNALIAVKDANGTILWSWHIWVVDFDPFRSGQVYIGGSMLMDRNLGALTVVPRNDGIDYSAYGLFYQGGRKDPFMIPDRGTIVPSDAITAVSQNLTSIEQTIPNPTVVYDNSYWGDDQTLWGEFKTKYDPCPAGWRVADKTVWDGITSDNIQEIGSYYTVIPEPYSTPKAYYPQAGRADGTQYSDYFHDYGWFWTSSYRDVLRLDYNLYLDRLDVDYRTSVRCMKDADFSAKTGIASNVKGTSFDVSGTVTVNDNTAIETVGFIYRENHSHMTDLKFFGDDVLSVETGMSNGRFSKTISGLKPDTQYEIRAYAKGGYNVRYGDIIYVKTISSGTGEGFDDDGSYDW